MATNKVTFTFDEVTVRRIEDAATRLVRSKSEIVREAVREYHERIGRLSEGEKLRMLRIVDEIAQRTPSRPEAAVNQELREIRNARRRGGRRHLS